MKSRVGIVSAPKLMIALSLKPNGILEFGKCAYSVLTNPIILTFLHYCQDKVKYTMKFNSKELVDLSLGEGTIEGRLHHKKSGGGYSHSVFKERWFKLRANILFYFNLSETGQVFGKKPIGAFILENVIVQYEMNGEVPFSFSIYFIDEVEKKHLFSGRTQDNINKWVAALKQASYEYWRSQLIMLQEKLHLLTGQDPLLMYPRNEGCRHMFEESRNIYQNKVQISTSNFYTANENSSVRIDEQNKKPCVPCSHYQNNDLKKNSTNRAPPIRPARGNKPKLELGYNENLIEL